jgi:hypothetical protein
MKENIIISKKIKIIFWKRKLFVDPRLRYIYCISCQAINNCWNIGHSSQSNQIVNPYSTVHVDQQHSTFFDNLLLDRQCSMCRPFHCLSMFGEISINAKKWMPMIRPFTIFHIFKICLKWFLMCYDCMIVIYLYPWICLCSPFVDYKSFFGHRD